jgi:hypothetical protein
MLNFGANSVISTTAIYYSEQALGEATDRTHQRCFQNRSLTNKRLSESSWTSTPISTDLSNHFLLQL